MDDVADSARAYFLRGRPAPAEVMLRRALGVSKPRTRADSIRHAARTELLAESFWRQALRDAEADSVAQAAVSMRSALHGPEDRAVARARATQARVWRYSRSPLAAATGLEQALELYERPGTEPDSVMADMLVSLGNVRREMGRTAEAVAALEEAVAIRRRVLGDSHRDVARALLNLALAQEADGAGTERLATEREAIAILENTTPLDSLGVYRIRLNHSSQLFQTQRYLEAGPHVLRARELAALLFPLLSYERAGVELNVANYLLYAGDLTASRRHFDSCGSIYRSGVLGDSTIGEGIYWENRSHLEELDGRLDSAAVCARHSLSILQRGYRFRPTSVEGIGIASASDRLGQLRAMQDRLEEAAELFSDAIHWSERFRSPEHPGAAHALEQLAAVRLRLGHLDSVRTPAVRAAGILSRYVRRSLSGMTEDEALRYRDRGATLALQSLLSLACADSSRENVAAAWSALLRNSGLVAAEIAARRRLLHATRDTTLTQPASALVRVRSQLSRAELRLVPDPGLDSLRRSAEALERELARRSSALARDLAIAEVTPERIAAAVPAQTALVHFVRFARMGIDPVRRKQSMAPAQRVGGAAPVWYGAFVLRSGESAPRWLLLAPASELDPLFERWRSLLAAGGVPGSRDLSSGRALRQKLWDPVERALAGASLTLIVPEGPLAVLPLGTLPADRGGPLVERGPTIHLLHGVRDLLREPDVGAGRRALVLGGADYEASPSAFASGRQASPATAAFRGRDRECRELAAERYLALPGSLDEARRVAKSWSGAPSRTTDLLTATQASEARVRANAPGCQLIHLATHGYLVPDSCALATSSDRLQLADIREVPVPPGSGGMLLRTGLVFAGVNAPGPDPSDDGLLTAADLAMLDLGEARLVVLSACESGRGSIVGAEGVVGLRWALMQAGARSSLTSAHRVSDEATLRWMDHFYAHWLTGATGVAEAARKASRELRRELIARTGEDRPGLWGAFLSAGDWR